MNYGTRTQVALALLVNLFVSVFTVSDAHAYDERTKMWISTQVQGRFTEETPFGIFLEGVARASAEEEDVYESYVRAALTYKAAFGNLFLGTFARFGENGIQNERRQWVQWSNSYELDSILEGLRASFRFRQERREIWGVAEPIYRTRFQVRLQTEALRISETVLPFFSQELFFNLNASDPKNFARTKVESGWVQSRSFLGVNVTVFEKFRVDIGYLGVILNQPTREDQYFHVLNSTLQFSF